MVSLLKFVSLRLSKQEVTVHARTQFFSRSRGVCEFDSRIWKSIPAPLSVLDWLLLTRTHWTHSIRNSIELRLLYGIFSGQISRFDQKPWRKNLKMREERDVLRHAIASTPVHYLRHCLQISGLTISWLSFVSNQVYMERCKKYKNKFNVSYPVH